MSNELVFGLYLFPVICLFGAFLIAGFTSWIAQLLTGKLFPRLSTLAFSIISTPMAYLFLKAYLASPEADTPFLHLPFYLQASQTIYGICGLILGLAALIGFGALLSEQIDNTKKSFQSADTANHQS